MVFIARLIFCQCILVLMKAQEGVVASFTSFDGVCDCWTSNDESLVENARELSQGS